MFFEIPMISTGTGSGTEPEKTVHATAFIPGFTSLNFMISTGPAFGRTGAASAPHPGIANTATKPIAARNNFMPVLYYLHQNALS
jgi:hypothetical protein